MYPKRSSQGDGSVAQPVRTSDRIRRIPKNYGRSYFYSYPTVHAKKRKTKTRTAATQIAKMLLPGSRSQRTPNASSIATNLRRSSRKRVSMHFEDYTDSSGMEDEDLMVTNYRSTMNRGYDNSSQDDLSTPKSRKLRGSRSVPRREGLRPRRSNTMSRSQSNLHSDAAADEPATSDEKVGPDETENGNDGDGDGAQNGGIGEDDADAEGEDDGDGDGDGEDDDDDDDDDDEQEGRRRYHLRNRTDVQRHSVNSSKKITRSPRRVLYRGMGNKVGRDVRKGGSRVHKRHRMPRADDSDDSFLVDELDQGPQIPWARGGNRTGLPWLLGGLDMHGSSSWGLNVASGWGHQSDAFAAISSGVQTAGPSSKGGADIQPLQVDENVSFDDIGGLSEYIDSLKEMVFFPLLYPDFFTSYHITPPRGVLLCGPPGTGKTLIARALASAASKAGQKVSFYMRKGADVLSKWVGEAERQLKLLFEEAQRNQPSIIFFDEIDGLAPVRSSKQEQIHNSIVSTLLALMDGLDSRGQVVLIGATNRIDAIDGALRRPGRFDREFNFPLPGSAARAEILDIHTRKWKMPPSKELRLELAASCVGYCGADLKSLCTEAAIRAFRERYPQVYTSDDKFLIDVDSVKVQKYHFLESMSAITPAAHRGSIVHSRPLSSVVASCLKGHLEKAMAHLSDIFPPISFSSNFSPLSVLSYGFALPLVYKPRLLLCGSEGVGLDHLGPAILHEMEKFPVHSLGLPSLLSDPSAKTPEEALVHIFGEARRTTPSILYLPQFHLWWETAHEQLRAVLLTLLEELPSDLPILLLGISQVAPDELGPSVDLIFPQRSVYRVGNASAGGRELFFHCLIEASLSVASSNAKTKDSSESVKVPELPKAPQVPAGPKPTELKAKFESEQHALRRFRMCLRDICNRVLYDKRFRDFHFPVTEEDAPNYKSIIQNPLDVSTLLQRVDSGQYITCSTFLHDVDLIVSNAKVYNGDDYNGARLVSRAHELRDSVHGMLSQMDPALISYCDKIAAQGGPMILSDDIGLSTFPSIPLVQLGTVTRASARLRNSQPELDVDRSFEALKRPKKNLDSDSAQGALSAEEQSKPSNEEEMNVSGWEAASPTTMDVDPTETAPNAASTSSEEGSKCRDEILDADDSSKVETIKQCFVKHTKKYDIPQLERLYNRVLKGVLFTTRTGDEDHLLLRKTILRFLFKFAQEKANFSHL